MAKMVPKRYTLGEEIFSSVTHGIGSLLAIGGTAVLIVLAAIYSDAWSVVGCAIFGASLIVLYCMSTLYPCDNKSKGKELFQNNGSQHDFFPNSRNIYADHNFDSSRRNRLGAVRNSVGSGGTRNRAQLNRPRKIPQALGCVLYRDGLGNNICHTTAFKGNELVELVAACGRRSILHGRRYLLRDKKGKVFPLDLAYIHGSRQRLSLLFNINSSNKQIIYGSQLQTVDCRFLRSFYEPAAVFKK